METVKTKRRRREAVRIIRDNSNVPPELRELDNAESFWELISTPPEEGKNRNGKEYTKYDPVKTPQMAYKLTKLFGCNRNELAIALGVPKKTIDYWRRRHLNFCRAIIRGMQHWDSLEIEGRALKDRAIGYNYEEIKTEEVEVDGVDTEGITVKLPAKRITKTLKHIPADVKAIKFWLSNREKSRWASEERVHLETYDIKEERKVLELSIKGADSETLEKAYSLLKDLAPAAELERCRPKLFLPERIDEE